MRRLLATMLLLSTVSGCSEDHSKSADVPLDKVPETVMKVAKEKLPEVNFDQAWKTTNGNFEVRGKTKTGKVRDIQIRPTGEVVEID